MAPRLRLLPLGPQGLDPGLIDWLAGALEQRLSIATVVEEPVELREEWFDPERGQFSSNLVVDALVEDAPAGDPAPEDWVLAVTQADLFAEDRDFVFGEATLGGRWALISLSRIRTPDRGLLRQRALKEAVHEIGHLAGLEHCERQACAMHPSRDAPGVDRRGANYCGACHRALPAGPDRP